MLPGRAIRVVFMGSDTLSCPFLRALAESPDVEVAAVVTQPDRACDGAFAAALERAPDRG